jgi:putative adenylate-forming enzyme
MKKLKIIYFYLKHKFRIVKNLKNYQNKKFEILKKTVLSKSKFYKKYDNFEDFPIINKKIMMENFDNLNTKGLSSDECFSLALKSEDDRCFSPKINNITVGLSSGTSGSRGLFLADEIESAIWAGHILSKTLHEGLFAEYNIAFFLRANSNLYESINTKKIKLNYFDLKDNFNKLLINLETQNPNIIIAPSQVIIKIAEAIKNKTINISPKRVYYVAEVLDDKDKLFVENIFNIKLDSIYQATEGFLGITCKNKKLHLNEEDLIIEKEWIDDKRFYPIITDLKRRTQPIVRYKLDDILLIDNQECDCGNLGTIIKKVEGRKDDILVLRKNNKKTFIFPDVLRHKMISMDGVENYKVIQNDYMNFTIEMENIHNIESIRKKIKLYLKDFSDETLIIEFKEYKKNKIENKLRRIEKRFNDE